MATVKDGSLQSAGLATCKKCGHTGQLSGFTKDNRRPLGICFTCLECTSKQKKIARLNDVEGHRARERNATARARLEPEKLARNRKRSADWAVNNAERTREIKQAWYQRQVVTPEYKAKVRAQYEATREEKREYDRRYRAERAEHLLAIKAAWRAENMDLVRQIKKRWKAKNADYIRKWALKRARQIGQATPPWLSENHVFEIERLYSLAASQIEPHHVDHIIPLHGKTVCGLHVPWNLRVVPKADNLNKGNRMPDPCDYRATT